MSVMSKRVFKKIRGNNMIEKLILPNNMVIKAAGGKRLIPIGAYRIPLDFIGRIIVQDFIKIDQLLSDAILGIDFINQNNIIIRGKVSGTEVMETAFLEEINDQMAGAKRNAEEVSGQGTYAMARILKTVPAKSAICIPITITSPGRNTANKNSLS